jgi:phosphoglycolate phosphatase
MSRVRFGELVAECRAVVFDKDGTLLDSLAVFPRLILRRVDYIRRQVPLEPEVAEKVARAMGWRPDTDRPHGRVLPRSPAVLGSTEDTVAVASAVLFLERDLAWDEAVAAVRQALSQCDEEEGLEWQAVAVPGAAETLRALSQGGCRIGVATNDDAGRAELLMRYAGLAPYIRAYAGRNEVLRGKPFPDLMQLLCRRLGVTPEHCAVVGDSEMDLKMGASCGAGILVGVLTGASSRKELEGVADVVLTSVAEISLA